MSTGTHSLGRVAAFDGYMPDLEVVLHRLNNDPSFAQALATSPRDALSGYNLSHSDLARIDESLSSSSGNFNPASAPGTHWIKGEHPASSNPAGASDFLSPRDIGVDSGSPAMQDNDLSPEYFSPESEANLNPAGLEIDGNLNPAAISYEFAPDANPAAISYEFAPRDQTISGDEVNGDGISSYSPSVSEADTGAGISGDEVNGDGISSYAPSVSEADTGAGISGDEVNGDGISSYAPSVSEADTGAGISGDEVNGDGISSYAPSAPEPPGSGGSRRGLVLGGIAVGLVGAAFLILLLLGAFNGDNKPNLSAIGDSKASPDAPPPTDRTGSTIVEAVVVDPAVATTQPPKGTSKTTVAGPTATTLAGGATVTTQPRGQSEYDRRPIRDDDAHQRHNANHESARHDNPSPEPEGCYGIKPWRDLGELLVSEGRQVYLHDAIEDHSVRHRPGRRRFDHSGVDTQRSKWDEHRTGRHEPSGHVGRLRGRSRVV